MSRSTLLAFGLLAMLGVGVASLATSAQQPKVARSEALPDKAVFVQAKEQIAATLERPQIRKLGGRDFVVGKETDSAYTKGRFGAGIMWIPLDNVTQLVEVQDIKRDK
jgi:hypothetical protein